MKPPRSALVEFMVSGSPSTGAAPVMLWSERPFDVSGSILQAHVPWPNFIDPSEAPCSVPSDKDAANDS